MHTVQVKASGPWRALEILGGLIVIILGLVVLADPQFAVATLVFIVATGLVIVGLFRMVLGLFAHYLPERLRILNILGGFAAAILGVVALLSPELTIETLILVLALTLVLVGLIEIGVGFARHPPIWLRAMIVFIGVLTVLLALLVVLDPAIGNGILAAILAGALILLGMRNILHGITGHHPMQQVDAAGKPF